MSIVPSHAFFFTNTTCKIGMPSYRLDCGRQRFYGIMFSPNFPNAYPHNSSLQTSISSAYGNSITLKMQHFDLEMSKDCIKDSLKIYENSMSNKALMSTRCGNDTTEYISRSNLIYLLFTSDSTIVGTGYRIHYESMRLLYNKNSSTGVS